MAKTRKIKQRPKRRAKRKTFEQGLLIPNQPYLVLDVETGGLDPKQHSLIEFSYAVIINQFIPVRRQIYMNHGRVVTDKALEINGIERKAIKEFMSYEVAAHQFIEDMGKVVSAYSDKEYLIPIGHNIQFDLGFIEQWLRDANEHEFYWLYLDAKHAVDTLQLARMARQNEWIIAENAKLETIASYFGVHRKNAHTAKADVEMTIDILERLLRMQKKYIEEGVEDGKV